MLLAYDHEVAVGLADSRVLGVDVVVLAGFLMLLVL